MQLKTLKSHFCRDSLACTALVRKEAYINVTVHFNTSSTMIQNKKNLRVDQGGDFMYRQTIDPRYKRMAVYRKRVKRFQWMQLLHALALMLLLQKPSIGVATLMTVVFSWSTQRFTSQNVYIAYCAAQLGLTVWSLLTYEFFNALVSGTGLYLAKQTRGSLRRSMKKL